MGAAGARADEGVALGGCGCAARGVAGAAGRALAAGNTEGTDDEIAGLDGRDGLAHLDDCSDVFVAHALLVDGLSTAVGPQVRATNAGSSQLDDGVRGFQDRWHRHVFKCDVAGFVHDNSAHDTPRVEGSVPITLVRQ